VRQRPINVTENPGIEMTTLFATEITCAACGLTFETTEVGSTNAFGSMDLDAYSGRVDLRFRLTLTTCPQERWC
jgi:hypothetical protein